MTLVPLTCMCLCSQYQGAFGLQNEKDFLTFTAVTKLVIVTNCSSKPYYYLMTLVRPGLVVYQETQLEEKKTQ